MPSKPPVIFLHIGAMKTGTSYLQQLLGDNKAVLAEQGVLFPGPDGWSDQVVAVRDILDLRVDAEIRGRAQGAWDRLRDEMFAWEGRASVVSMEFLSFANAKRARRVLNSLKGADVHVILTVRDSSRVIPAQWQEGCQNRGTTSWSAYTSSVLAGPDHADEDWRTFRRALGVPRMLDNWGTLLPADRLHVVLVPASREDPSLLWRRYASVIGVDPDSCTPPTGQRNASLGYASADLVRRVNAHLGDVGQFAYTKTMKAYLSKQVLAARTGEPKVSTNSELAAFALDWNRSMSDAIAKSGAHVIGEPDDLDVAQIDSVDIEPPSQEALLDAAVDAVTGLQKLIGTRTQRLVAAHEARGDTGSEPSQGTVPVVDPHSWTSQEDPVDCAAQDVARLAMHAITLRTALRAADGKPVGDQSFEESQPTGQRPGTSGVVGRVMRRVRPR
ncbi:MAG: hypothetical protein M3419_08085 [Actinomycetota bacterium]|nr:hypothetical protein [Actinomycetota bacterium]